MNEQAMSEEKLENTVDLHLKDNPAAEDIVLFFSVLGRCMLLSDWRVISRMYDYVRCLQRNHADNPESRIYGLVEGMTAMLESFFAALEPVQRMAKLVEEFKGDTMWQLILRALSGGGQEGMGRTAINNTVKARMPGVVLGMPYMLKALEEFQVRELVEFWPDPASEQERLFSLTNLGRKLLAELGER